MSSKVNYYRYNFDYSCPLGQDLEDYLRQASLEVFGKSYKRATVDQDRYEGTDCFIHNTRIDFTYAGSKKNKTVWMKSYEAEGISFKYGIRFGNSKDRNFKVPVLVVAVDIYDDAEMRMMINKVVDVYQKHAKDIIGEGRKEYYHWLEKNPDWRKGPKPRKRYNGNRPRVTSISYC